MLSDHVHAPFWIDAGTCPSFHFVPKPADVRDSTYGLGDGNHKECFRVSCARVAHHLSGNLFTQVTGLISYGERFLDCDLVSGCEGVNKVSRSQFSGLKHYWNLSQMSRQVGSENMHSTHSRCYALTEITSKPCQSQLCFTGFGLLEGPTRKPRHASVFSTHSDTQAVPAFHCIRMFKDIFSTPAF